MQELEHWKTKFDIASSATEGFFSKQWLAKKLFGMSDEDFIKNRRQMFYDRKFEAALETAGEAEQAEATAGIDAGADAGLGGDMGGDMGDLGGDMGDLGGDMGEPGGTGTVGAETEPAADTGGEEGDLLAAPPGKREDKKGRTTTSASHGWYEPRGTKPGGDRRKSSGPRKKNMNRAASPETGTTRKMFPGMGELSGLARGTSVYAEENTNYKVEELKILNDQKELKRLFESLQKRDEKNETETQ